jgi:hypothetical protein
MRQVCAGKLAASIRVHHRGMDCRCLGEACGKPENVTAEIFLIRVYLWLKLFAPSNRNGLEKSSCKTAEREEITKNAASCGPETKWEMSADTD